MVQAPRVVDAFFWLKTPGESDGCTQTLPEADGGGVCPRYGRLHLDPALYVTLCNSVRKAPPRPRPPEYSPPPVFFPLHRSACISSSVTPHRYDTGCQGGDSIGAKPSEPRAPEAGHWFPYQARMLARNARLQADRPGSLDSGWTIEAGPSEARTPVHCAGGGVENGVRRSDTQPSSSGRRALPSCCKSNGRRVGSGEAGLRRPRLAAGLRQGPLQGRAARRPRPSLVLPSRERA